MRRHTEWGDNGIIDHLYDHGESEVKGLVSSISKQIQLDEKFIVLLYRGQVIFRGKWFNNLTNKSTDSHRTADWNDALRNGSLRSSGFDPYHEPSSYCGEPPNFDGFIGEFCTREECLPPGSSGDCFAPVERLHQEGQLLCGHCGEKETQWKAFLHDESTAEHWSLLCEYEEWEIEKMRALRLEAKRLIEEFQAYPKELQEKALREVARWGWFRSTPRLDEVSDMSNKQLGALLSAANFVRSNN